MNVNCKKALILAPHTDDGELGCGATIAKLLRQGSEVFYVAFSSCRDSLPEGAAPDLLIREMHRATAALGIPGDHTRVLDFRVRHFAETRQDILDSMIALGRELHPDLVFMPSRHDIHQDHAVIAAEGMRAFKKTTILQYEAPWNNFSFDNQLFNRVEESDVAAKVRAIACYDSQAGRDYTKEEFIRGLLLTHGVQIGVPFAEVFEIPRMVWEDTQ